MAGKITDYISRGAGAPTAAPDLPAGESGLYINTTDHSLWVYDGTWTQIHSGSGGAGSAAALKAAVLADSPVHYWPLDDDIATTGFAVDAGPNNVNLTPSVSGGIRGQFDAGVADALCMYCLNGALVPADLSHLPTSGSMTIEGWVARGYWGHDHVPLGYWGAYDSNGPFGIRLEGDHSFYTWANSGNSDAEQPWYGWNGYQTMHHVVLSVDDSTKKRSVYVDSVLVFEDVYTNTYTITPSESFVGATDPGGSDLQNVRLMHVAFYGAALSANRVRAHYQALVA